MTQTNDSAPPAALGSSGEARLAVIGGSGFYDMPGLEDRAEVVVETPFGPTSDPIITGRLNGMPVARRLARQLLPHRSG